MLAEIDQTSRRIPGPWLWADQPALFPGLVDPSAALWAAGKPENHEGITYGYQALARHVFYQAVKDAEKPTYGGSEARRWLSDSGYELLTLAGVGVQPDLYRKWLAAGCPLRGGRLKHTRGTPEGV